MKIIERKKKIEIPDCFHCPFFASPSYCEYYQNKIWIDIEPKNRPAFCKVKTIEVQEGDL